ncbi:MAG TPA: metalloregulator ArsR/SmtB family transcription factor [Victivallales bacterium]|nr:metalloregulator ArsR/SmtB family transcription factor [Victivallales bacterium]
MNKMDTRAEAKLLKAMAHPVRLKILDRLSIGPCCANAAHKTLPISQPNLSQHLRALRKAGLIKFEKRGVRRCYFLSDKILIRKLLASIKGFLGA